jgi:hypothetical protein
MKKRISTGPLGIAVLLAAMTQLTALPAPAATVDLLPSLSDQGAWSVAELGGLEARALEMGERIPDTVGVRVFKVDGADWHISVMERPKVKLIDGHRYTLTLWARADTARDIRVVAMLAGKGRHNVGLDATMSIGFPYQSFTESFVALGTGGHPSQVAFAVGQTTGSVWIQHVELVDDGPAAASQATPSST